MLRLKDVSYGFIPFGPAIGERAIFITIGNGDEEKDFDLFTELESVIDKSKLNDEFINAIDGSNSTFLVFNGGEIEDDTVNEEWDNFNRKLSKKSIDIQMALKKRTDQLRPPFCIWSGVPKKFTSTKTFYEYFNCCYAIIKNEDYSQMALQEIINHKFSAIIVISDDFKIIIENLYSKYNVTRKLFLIGNENEKLFSLANGIRFNIANGYNEEYIRSINES